MKILHTADWHIGKVLHKHPLSDEMQFFFDWLIALIVKEEVDVLLVSGDIFDRSNPAVEDRSLYYKFLSQLIGTKTKIIITGGNHDSVTLIDAPNEILKQLDVTVIGGARENLEEEIVEVKDAEGKVSLVVAAVPFLRDKDVRNRETDKKYKNKAEAIRAGIQKHYEDVGAIIEVKYPSTPAIAMGHLYARGADTSESERDIHVGNAAAIDSSIFPSVFDYVALGHIHRPQRIDNSDMIRYSGSPIALSFSEKADEKCILLLTLENDKLQAPQRIEIPKQRALKKFSGDYITVKKALDEYAPDFPLISFVEVEVKEKEFSAATLTNVSDMVSETQDSSQFKILKSKTTFANREQNTADLFQAGTNIEDLSPQDVFEKRLALEGLSDEKNTELMEAFLEILESVEK